ncbi:MAG: very short patch repair endonuclease [Emcibacter sp.]|nr:very short patch repair endonuclease [Emcibacter sp.]
MTDVVTSKKRSEMMTGIKGKDTRPEMIIRRALFREGFRYRLHDKKLPGKPDLVLRKYNAVIFINGCFWHGHSCHLFKWPKSRPEFWRNKISGNKARDARNIDNLTKSGWRILTIWECALKGKHRRSLDDIISGASDFLLSDDPFLTIEYKSE